MTLLYYDPRFLDHETGPHPECALRLSTVVEHLKQTELLDECTRPDWQPVADQQLLRIHDADYLARVREVAEQGGGQLDPDTAVSRASWDVARLAAGAACDAVARVVEGQDDTALCLVRPPGHHALARRGMGFCLLNNVAVAARAAIDEHGLDRVLVADWDVHHGNGTQDAFYDDEQVGFLSIHRWPFYPGTGAADETGTGDGLGTTRNLPTAFGTSQVDYQKSFRRGLEDLAERVKPQLMLVSAGFDSHREDPIGSLGLETEDFAVLTETVIEVARQHAGGRIVSLLEGGYNPAALARSVETHLEHLIGSNHSG